VRRIKSCLYNSPHPNLLPLEKELILKSTVLRVGWGEVKIRYCKFLLITDKDMKEILITYFLFPLTQPNHVGLSLPNTLRVNANTILSYLSLWRGLLRTNVIKKTHT